MKLYPENLGIGFCSPEEGIPSPGSRHCLHFWTQTSWSWFRNWVVTWRVRVGQREVNCQITVDFFLSYSYSQQNIFSIEIGLYGLRVLLCNCQWILIQNRAWIPRSIGTLGQSCAVPWDTRQYVQYRVSLKIRIFYPLLQPGKRSFFWHTVECCQHENYNVQRVGNIIHWEKMP